MRKFIEWSWQYIVAALLLIGIVCVFSDVPRAQMSLLLRDPIGGSCAAASTTAYTNFVGRSGPLGADDCNYRTLFSNLTTHGLFASDGTTTLLCFLYVFAAPNTTVAKLDLTNAAHNATYSGTPAESAQFAAHAGYTGDGSTTALDSGLAPSSCSLITTNSGGIGYYSLTSRTGTPSSDYGSSNASNSAFYILNFNSGVTQCDISSGSFTGPTLGLNADGYWTCTSTASGTIHIYHNGSSTDLGPISVTGTTVTALNVHFLALNNNGTNAVFTTDQLAAGFLTAGLSGSQSANLANDINTFMANYGRNIF